MHKQKNNILPWVIGFLVLLIITIGVGYVIGSQQHEHNTTNPSQTTKNKDNTSDSSSSTVTKSNKATTNSNASSAKASNIPSQFWGTWYEGSKKYAIISANKFILASAGITITKSSLPLQLCDDRGSNGTYEIYHNPNPNATGAEGGDGNAYWIGNLTVDGKKERVLALYVRQGYFEIFTSHPTSKNLYIQYDEPDWAEQIGNSDLDSLKDRSRKNLNRQDQSSKQDNSDDNNDNSYTDNNDNSNTNNDSSSTDNKINKDSQNSKSNTNDNQSANDDSDDNNEAINELNNRIDYTQNNPDSNNGQ